MAETHRLLRVIEYVGTAEFILEAIEKRGIKGERTINGPGNRQGRIREGLIGETAELLPGFTPTAASAAIKADIVSDEIEQATRGYDRV